MGGHIGALMSRPVWYAVFKSLPYFRQDWLEWAFTFTLKRHAVEAAKEGCVFDKGNKWRLSLVQWYVMALCCKIALMVWGMQLWFGFCSLWLINGCWYAIFCYFIHAVTCFLLNITKIGVWNCQAFAHSIDIRIDIFKSWWTILNVLLSLMRVCIILLLQSVSFLKVQNACPTPDDVMVILLWQIHYSAFELPPK